VDFKNAVVIMTSNIGARFIQKKSGLGFKPDEPSELGRSLSDVVLREVRRTFNPEFLNRIDEIIVFDPLSDADLRHILTLLIGQLNERLAERGLNVRLTDEAASWIVEATCGDRLYGARPLRRAVQKYVEDPLSERLIRGTLGGGQVEVLLEGAGLGFRPLDGVAQTMGWPQTSNSL
jgi:ATP-dependent Clp protease ATP-binding subunit ClpC